MSFFVTFAKQTEKYMKKSLLIALLLVPVLGMAQNNRVQNYIDTQMKTFPQMQNAIVGIIAVDKNDNVIAQWNPDMPMLTASTMKTITTGLGFEVLGPDYKFSTRIATDGQVKDGVLNGNLYIVGGADPTLGSRDTIAFCIDSIFGIWAQAVKDAGIHRINGQIIADDRFYADENIPTGWTYGNIGYDYGSGTTGLNFAENLSYFEVSPGEKVGDPVSIVALGPDNGMMKYYTGKVVTDEPRTGDGTEYYASCIEKCGEFIGTYAVDRRTDTIAFSNKYGPMTCACEFYNYLQNKGVYVKGYTDLETFSANFSAPEQTDLNYICETFSPELRKIVKVTNTISNNFFAETIYKTVGKTLIERETGKPCYGVTYWRADRAIKKYLESRGVDITGYTQDDGSGLSRENYISPRFFTRFYKMMTESSHFDEYMHTFPGPGRPGTLESVLPKADPKIKATIYAKSGSLSSVRCYAGYVDSKRGLIRFAILTNNYACPTRVVQPKIEGFLEALGKYGNKQ